MENLKVQIVGVVKMEFDITPDNQSILRSATTSLEALPHVYEELLFDENLDMNEAGLKAMSNAFISGLKNSMETGHTLEIWDKYDHYEWIIKHLQKILKLQVDVVHSEIAPNLPES